MGTVEVEVEIGAGNVGVPESERLLFIAWLDLEGALRVLAQAVQRGTCLGERGGELDVLLLEDEKGVGLGGGVEDDIV